jgi:hypothetical protein
MFDFSNFIFNFQVDVRIMHQNSNFYLKNHKIILIKNIIWMIDSEFAYFEIILNQKSIIALLKLSFHQILLWLNGFHDSMNSLTNILNSDADWIKRDFEDIFINEIC